MMAIGAYQSRPGTHLDTIFGGKMSPIDKPADARENGPGIVKGSERVNHSIESVIYKTGTNVTGKTASQHHNLVLV